MDRKKFYKIKYYRSCPERFCFLWDCNNNRCDECYKSFSEANDCLRRNLAGTADYYELCEPELQAARLPIKYFCNVGKRNRQI